MSAQTPPITDVLTTRLGADYLEQPFAFFIAVSNAADNFAGCSLVGGIYLNGQMVLDLSTYATITQPNLVNIAVPVAVMSPLGTGTFKVSLSLVTPSGQTQDLLDYVLRVETP